MQEQSVYPEKDLLLQVAEGNETAFQTLFMRYGPMLKTYLLKLSRSKETAEDIIHDVFLEIWKNKEGLTGIELFKPYLFRAVHNRAHRSFMRQAKMSLILNELQKEQDIVSPFEGEERVIHSEVRKIIQQAVEKLTSRQKQIFLLSRHEGLKHEEIARLLNINTQTVSNHLSDALRLLREEIGTSCHSYSVAIYILYQLQG